MDLPEKPRFEIRHWSRLNEEQKNQAIKVMTEVSFNTKVETPGNNEILLRNIIESSVHGLLTKNLALLDNGKPIAFLSMSIDRPRRLVRVGNLVSKRSPDFVRFCKKYGDRVTTPANELWYTAMKLAKVNKCQTLQQHAALISPHADMKIKRAFSNGLIGKVREIGRSKEWPINYAKTPKPLNLKKLHAKAAMHAHR